MNLDRALAQSKHSTPKCSGPTAWTRWVTCPLGFWIRYFRTDLRERVAINCLLRKKGSPKRQCGRNWSVKEELIFFFPKPPYHTVMRFTGYRAQYVPCSQPAKGGFLQKLGRSAGS